MRVSDSTITSMAMNAVTNSNNLYSDIIKKITTNKNFSSVSENPTDAIKVLKLNDQLSKLDIYQNNIDAATNEMSFTYDILADMSDELGAINSLIVQASNSTTSKDSAKAIATEIRERVNTIQDKLNSKYLDNYIFSGTFTGVQTFQKEDGIATYKGSSSDAGARQLTIAEGTKFQFNITGDKLFGSETYYFNDENGVRQAVESDFFHQMDELNTLLTSDNLDYNKIREKLSVTGNSIENITLAQGNISAQVSKLDTTKNLNDSTIIGLTENKADLEEVDIIKAATDLANAQTAMQASYLLSTRILSNVSLLDYL